MKTKYWIAILGILLLICTALSIPLLMPGQAATHAEIVSEGTLLHTVDLRIDQEITVTNSRGGTNIVTVQGGKIAVIEADCPDHYCMQRGWCGGGAQIVCLPNRLVIRVTEEQGIDGMSG